MGPERMHDRIIAKLQYGLFRVYPYLQANDLVLYGLSVAVGYLHLSLFIDKVPFAIAAKERIEASVETAAFRKADIALGTGNGKAFFIMVSARVYPGIAA